MTEKLADKFFETAHDITGNETDSGIVEALEIILDRMGYEIVKYYDRYETYISIQPKK